MKIGFKIDNEDNVSLVQGEDRVLKIRLLDDDTKIPVDLTGASIKFEAKSKQGGKLVVRSTALTFVDSAVDVANDKISLPAHGLAEGQKIQLLSGGTLPAGLALLTNYYVKIADENSIQLLSAPGGSVVDITAAAGGGTHTVDVALATIDGNDAVLGTISVPMDDTVTSQLKGGEKQTPEIEYTISGVTRVIQLSKAFNVLEQVV